MSPGIILALIAALFSSLRGIARKHVSRDFSSVEIGLMGQVYGVLLLLPFAAWRFSESGISFKPSILGAVAVSSAVVLASTYIYIEALRIADISITEPLRNTSPILVALLEPLLLGIDFSIALAGAAVMGSAGAYILLAKDSLLTPVENIKNRGAIFATISAALIALYSIARRFGATNTDPLLFSYMIYVIGLVGFWTWKKKEDGNIELNDLLRKDVFAMGTVTALGVVTGIYAYSFISASKVVVVQQTSIIFSVIIGGKFFREESLTRKLIGGLVIILGVLLVVL